MGERERERGVTAAAPIFCSILFSVFCFITMPPPPSSSSSSSSSGGFDASTGAASSTRSLHEPDARLLGFRTGKLSNELIRKEFLALARKKCDASIRTFLACSKEQGLMVVFRCRDENRAMNACLGQYTKDDALFREYRDARRRQFQQEKHQTKK